MAILRFFFRLSAYTCFERVCVCVFLRRVSTIISDGNDLGVSF